MFNQQIFFAFMQFYVWIPHIIKKYENIIMIFNTNAV